MEKSQQKINPMTLQLASLRNYVIFLAITMGLVNVLVLAFSGWTVLLNFLWLTRVTKTKQLKLGLGCFFVAIFASLLFSGVRLQENIELKKVVEEEQKVSLEVAPLSFVISGDYFRFDGREVSTKKRYRLHYRFENEAEKKKFSQIKTLSEVDVTLLVKEAAEQRNLNGFDYQKYLIQEKIYYFGDVVRIQGWEPSQRISLRRFVVQLRSSLYHSFTTRLPSPLGNQLSNLILGVKDEVLKEQQQQFSALGLNQLLSLSGLQIIYLTRLLTYLLRRFGVTLEGVFLAQLILFGFLFLFYWGMSVSLLRSLLYLTIKTVNYEKRLGLSQLDNWALTLMITLILRPYGILQVGGQLSFSLTFYWVFLKNRPASGESSFLRKFILSGLLALPLLAYHFYQWQVLSLVLTWLLLPIYVYLIWPTLIGSWLSTFVIANAPWLTMLSSLFTRLTTVLLKIGELSFFKVVSGTFPLAVLLLAIIFSLFFLARYQAAKKLPLLFLVLLVSLPLGFKYINPQGMVAFVDVGQAESTFIQLPFHQGNILIDTGGRLSFPREAWAERTVQQSNATTTLLPFLKSRGVKQLDYLFLTHADADHMGDLLEVAQEIKLKEIIYPLGMEEEPVFAAMLTKLTAKGLRGRGVLKGEQWQIGGVTFESLAPSKESLGTNDDSLVLRFVIKDTRFLQVGDLEMAGEKELIQTYPNLTHEVLSAGHHGSRTSSTKDFLEAVNPQVGIISAGENNSYGHPHLEVLDNFAEQKVSLYRTDKQGMIYYTWFPWSPTIGEPQTIRGEP